MKLLLLLIGDCFRHGSQGSTLKDTKFSFNQQKKSIRNTFKFN